MNSSIRSKDEPLKYITYVYPNDNTIRFQYLTKQEIEELKSKGIVEVDISKFKEGDDNG